MSDAVEKPQDDPLNPEHYADHAPGDEPGESPRTFIFNSVVGLVLATLLTIGSFGVVMTHLIWGPAVPVALVVLAIAQMGVHLIFFLHITTGPDNTNNALALAFGVLVVGLVVVGSIWIMANMAGNMAPMMSTSQMSAMQR